MQNAREYRAVDLMSKYSSDPVVEVVDLLEPSGFRNDSSSSTGRYPCDSSFLNRDLKVRRVNADRTCSPRVPFRRCRNASDSKRGIIQIVKKDVFRYVRKNGLA